MNPKYIFAALFFLTSSVALAQHADIEFSYEDQNVVVRDGIDGFTDGLQIFEGTFPTRGFSARFTENPGFLAEAVNDDFVLPGDDIEIEFVESSTFGSFLTYFDPVLGEMAPTDATIEICDNAGFNTADLFIGNLELTGENPQFIQTADSFSEVHSHIDFALSEVAEAGAYGFLFRLVTNNADIEDSPPIWLVFNFGMSPLDFEELALPAFIGTDVLLGDVNGDGSVDLLDVSPFVDAILSGEFIAAADINGDGVVDLLDVEPFVQLILN